MVRRRDSLSFWLAEQVAVRVGNSDPAAEGNFSNSLCAVAQINATSAMNEYECDEPLTGSFITVSRNDAGSMNICGFSANLGTVALSPVDALGEVYTSIRDRSNAGFWKQMQTAALSSAIGCNWSLLVRLSNSE